MRRNEMPCIRMKCYASSTESPSKHCTRERLAMFFDRLGRGWELAGQSWQVLKRDKELVLFPMLSGIACLLVVASFLVPFFVVPGFGAGIKAFLDEDRAGQQQPAAQIAYAAV